MLLIYITILLVSTAFSLDIPCQDGVLIETEPLKNYDYMIGNWKYAYQWDTQYQSSVDPIDNTGGRLLKCPGIDIESAAPDFVRQKQTECGDNKPFKWEDVKLKLNIPSLFVKDNIFFFGEKVCLLRNCKIVSEVKLIKVSDEVMILNDVTLGLSILMSRNPLRRTELDCLVKNIDVSKHLYGFGLCN